MCPRSVPCGAEGASGLLHAAWRYRLCFACFKAAFMELKEALEPEDWGDERWGPELTGSAEAGPGFPQSAAPGPDGWAWPATPCPPSCSLRMRTLGLGPEDADWTQGPPWRLGAPPACSHWPRPPPPWQGFLKVGLPPGEPMVLELGTTRAVDPTEAEAWLLDLQGVPVEGCYGATCLRKRTPGRALRPSGQCWKLLLGPEEVWVVGLHDAPQVQEPQRWKPSILECFPQGRAKSWSRRTQLCLRGGETGACQQRSRKL